MRFWVGKKSQYVHHDRLKPCNDSDFPMWLQRKRHALLTDSLPTDGEHDDEPLLPDEPLGLDDLFGYEDNDIDLDSTLPYMLGDDMQGRTDSSSDSSVDSGGDSDIDLPEAPVPIHDQRVKTRTGRKYQVASPLYGINLFVLWCVLPPTTLKQACEYASWSCEDDTADRIYCV